MSCQSGECKEPQTSRPELLQSLQQAGSELNSVREIARSGDGGGRGGEEGVGGGSGRMWKRRWRRWGGGGNEIVEKTGRGESREMQ